MFDFYDIKLKDNRIYAKAHDVMKDKWYNVWISTEDYSDFFIEGNIKESTLVPALGALRLKYDKSNGKLPKMVSVMWG